MKHNIARALALLIALMLVVPAFAPAEEVASPEVEPPVAEAVELLLGEDAPIPADDGETSVVAPAEALPEEVLVELPAGDVLLADAGDADAGDAKQVDYVGADGAALQADAVALAGDSAAVTLPGGWYVAEGNVSYAAGLTFTGPANLILADGCTLTVSGTGNAVAAVDDDGYCALAVYGQSGQSGRLTATGSVNGIAARLELYGGGVRATGTSDSGVFADGAFAVYGGALTAEGAKNGVCCYLNNTGAKGSIAISGGTVVAGGVNNGSCQAGLLGNVTLAGGTLTAGGSTLVSGTVAPAETLLADIVTNVPLAATGKLDLNGCGILFTGSGSALTASGGLELSDGAKAGARYVLLEGGRGTAIADARPDGTEGTDYLAVSGGFITGGSGSNGGGVYVKGGGFTVTGGTICGNKASNGGGVYVQSGGLTLSGGAVLGNTATGNGGGVCFFGDSFTLSGEAVVTGNATTSVTSRGGGVYFNNTASLHVSGAPTVSGNRKGSDDNDVYLLGGQTIAVSGALTDGADIRVACAKTPTAQATVLLTAGYANSNKDADPSAFFHSDDATYAVGHTAAGEACLGLALKDSMAVFDAEGPKTYDGVAVALTVTYGSRLLTEGKDYTVKRLRDGDEADEVKGAGAYTVLVTGAGCYAGTVEKAFVIDPLAVAITGLSAADKTYDGTTAATAAGTAVVEGALDGDDVTVAAGSAAFEDANAGADKPVRFTGYALAGDDAGNYALSGQPADATASIAAKALAIVADAKVKTFGDADPELTYSAEGLVGDDALTGSLSRDAGEAVGVYAIVLGTLSAGGNYAIDFTGAWLTIEPAPTPVPTAAPTEAPATQAPATEAPATQAPATEAPATEAPATEAPATEAPATEAPATQAPTPTPTPKPPVPDFTLLATLKTSGSKALKLSWTKVEGAAGYDVYFLAADAKGSLKRIATVKGGSKLSYTIKKLDPNREYKASVTAWKTVDGAKTAIGKASPTVYAITGGSTSSKANPKAVAVAEDSVVLAVGKTSAVKATVTSVKSGKKVLSREALVRYYSTDRNVATVSSKGKVKAKGLGACTVYAVANSGVRAAVKVTVTNQPTGAAFNASYYTVKVGRTLNLGRRLSLTPVGVTANCTWTSTKTIVAYVSSKGFVTGKKKGATMIIAKFPNGVIAKVKVKVE